MMLYRVADSVTNANEGYKIFPRQLFFFFFYKFNDFYFRGSDDDWSLYEINKYCWYYLKSIIPGGKCYHATA